MSAPDSLPDERAARIYPDSRSWLLKLPDEWDSMNEAERQDYIWEAAMDNGKFGFEYEEVPK